MVNTLEPSPHGQFVPFDDMTRMQKLELAEVLMESVKETFNATGQTCEHCGTAYKESWNDFHCAEATKAALTRIRRIKTILLKEDANGD